MSGTTGISEGALLPLWDDSHMYLWLVIFIASSIGLLIYLVWLIKKKRK
jgi:hypothetical protein